MSKNKQKEKKLPKPESLDSDVNKMILYREKVFYVKSVKQLLTALYKNRAKFLYPVQLQK